MSGVTTKTLSAGILTAYCILSFAAMAQERSAETTQKPDGLPKKDYYFDKDGNKTENAGNFEDLVHFYLHWTRLTKDTNSPFHNEWTLSYYKGYETFTSAPNDPNDPDKEPYDIQISFKKEYGDINSSEKTYVYLDGTPLKDNNNANIDPLLERLRPMNRRSSEDLNYIIVYGIDDTKDLPKNEIETGKKFNQINGENGLYYNHQNGNKDVGTDTRPLTEILLEKATGEAPSISGDFIRNNQAKTFGRYDLKYIAYKYEESKANEYPENSAYSEVDSNKVRSEHVKFILENYNQGNLTDEDKAALDHDNFDKRQGDTIAGGTVIFNTAITGTPSDKPGNDVLFGKDGKDGLLTKKSVLGDISGNFIGNYTTSENYQILGGVIYNGFNGVIGTISGTFIDNNVQQSGEFTGQAGVIYNHLNGIIKKIDGNFIGNFAANLSASKQDTRDIIGGVITNHGRIDEGVHGIFIGNYAYSANTANSGVVRNYSGPGYMGVLGKDDKGNSLSGTFIGNFTRAVRGDAYGGIMRNNGTLEGNIEGTFIGNYAEAQGNPSTKAGGIDKERVKSIYTVDRQGTPVGKYRYDSWLNEYIRYENDTDQNREKYKDDYVLKLEGEGLYHTGERTGLAQGGVFYNTIKTDGTAGTSVTLHMISGKFNDNYALSTWSEASGGVIYNQDATIEDIEGSFSGNHAVSLAHKARGGAIYNNLLLMKETKIGNIGNFGKADDGSDVYDENKVVQFEGNYAQGRIAGGGAIYASSYSTMGEIHAEFKNNYALSKVDLTEKDMETYKKPESHFGPGNSDRPDDYEFRARGGALFVDNYGEVANIYANFIGNYVKSYETSADEELKKYGVNSSVRGGAILVTTNGLIGHIAGPDGGLALFQGNYALGASPQHTFGGAIRFDSSVIDTLSANFTDNYTNGFGGAISLTETGFIYQVTGKFVGNTAGIAGGAVHNLGTIGYIGTLLIDDENGGVDNIDHVENLKDYERVRRDNQGRIVTHNDETQGKNQFGYKEYDGTIQGGFRNVQFIDNIVDGTDGADGYARQGGDRGLGGAIYTEGDLFIVADDPTTDTVFSGNKAIFEADANDEDYIIPDENNLKKLNTALYVKSASNTDDMPTIYLVAMNGAHMIIEDAIRGEETPGDRTTSTGFVLRLRGYINNGIGYKHQDNTGVIELSGPVAQSYAIMDDVHLQLGTCINYFSFGDNTSHNPKKYIYDQSKKDLYGRSDVFRKSHLSVRSGLVDLTADDGKISQFLFGTLTSYGRTFLYADHGAKDINIKMEYNLQKDRLFAQWAVDIDAKDKVADLITTFEVREDDGNTILDASHGRITLKTINMKRADGSPYVYDETKKPEDNTFGIDRESSLKVQILNLVVRKESGDRDVFDDSYYEKWGYRTDKAPIQLDNALRVVKWESSIMSSDEVLAEDIWLATTRTYHDSIEIVGWRDSLAAWAEMNNDITTANYDDAAWSWDTDENGNDTSLTETKIFTLVRDKKVHSLTRDVVDLVTKKKSDRGAIWGKNWTIRGEDRSLVLDLGGHNLLTIVKDDQDARLENFTLLDVKDNDILNEGHLTLDTMTLKHPSNKIQDKDVVVNNEGSLTIQGVMNIDFTITTDTTRRAVDPKEMIIDDRSNVTDGHTMVNIEGTIESQNITVKEYSNTKGLPADPTTATSVSFADANFTTVVNLSTTQMDGKTASEAFKSFTQQDKLNSLDMQGGKFNLGVMHDHVLQLNKWKMSGGAMYVASSTVDLEAEKMGGIRGKEAQLDGSNSGIIWLDNMLVSNDSKGSVTHVQFVNESMGDAVQDNNIRDSIKKGKIWYYEVTYNNDQLENDRGETGKNGWYTFRRLTDMATSEVQTGSVASLAGGYASMMQVYEYAFEHADLFSSTIANTRSSAVTEGNDYFLITPVKGYKEATPVAPATSPCPTNKAGLAHALWMRPYATFEKLPLDNGPKVNTNLYGALFGGDSELREHRDGWADVTSIYGAYMGASKRYDGIRSRQNGLGIGATETLYKGNFYTAITGMVSTSFGNTTTSYGSEKYNMFMAGLASRTGYNIILGSCDYVLQPTLLVSYTFINIGDYTNASGVRMDSDPLQVIQLHPYLKGTMHTTSGWDPYISAGYVYNLMGKSKFRANGEKLPEMSIDPYIEYNLGIQKTWMDRYTFYGQATGRHGGRNGFEISAGFRWVW